MSNPQQFGDFPPSTPASSRGREPRVASTGRPGEPAALKGTDGAWGSGSSGRRRLRAAGFATCRAASSPTCTSGPTSTWLRPTSLRPPALKGALCLSPDRDDGPYLSPLMLSSVNTLPPAFLSLKTEGMSDSPRCSRPRTGSLLSFAKLPRTYREVPKGSKGLGQDEAAGSPRALASRRLAGRRAGPSRGGEAASAPAPRRG